MIKVSVVMPVYNAEEFLRESIGDIVAQTFEGFELICVDDGSTDESAKIIKEFAKKNPQVKYLYQENAGAGAARNFGMKSAAGKYLLFLDADDRFESTMLEELWDRAEETMADIVVFGADCFQYGTERRREASWLLDKKYLTDRYIEAGVIKQDKKNEILYKISTSTVWNKLYKREFIQERGIAFQEIYVVDSMYFVMLSMAYAERIAVLEKKFVHYRENVPTGQIMNHDKSPTGVYEALHAVRQRMLKDGYFGRVEKGFVNYAVKSCLDRLACFDSCKAEELLYSMLHNEGFEKLGVDLKCNEHEVSRRMWEKCKRIQESEYLEYLYNKQNTLQQMINSSGFIYPLPGGLPEGKRKVAIYGAGNVGKSYFIQLLNRKEYELVGWYDKNYASYGFPTESPEFLREKAVDIILIAVQLDTVAKEIKKDLLKLGVDEASIIWEEPQIL